MSGEKITPDMKGIRRTPQRMERCDEVVEGRLRAALRLMAVLVRRIRRAGEGRRDWVAGVSRRTYPPGCGYL